MGWRALKAATRETENGYEAGESEKGLGRDLVMLIIHVLAIIKPESREAFLAAARDVIAQTRREPGSLGYSCYEDITERNVFIFYEEWRAKRISMPT